MHRITILSRSGISMIVAAPRSQLCAAPLDCETLPLSIAHFLLLERTSSGSHPRAMRLSAYPLSSRVLLPISGLRIENDCLGDLAQGLAQTPASLLQADVGFFLAQTKLTLHDSLRPLQHFAILELLRKLIIPLLQLSDLDCRSHEKSQSGNKLDLSSGVGMLFAML